MTKRQENKLSMYLTVQDTLALHQATWQAKPAFVEAKAAFDGALDDIDNLVQQQEATSTGATSQKQIRRVTMTERALPVSGALVAFAHKNENGELADNAAVTRTDLLHGRDMDALIKAQNLLSLANTHAVALADYITAGEITLFSQSITQYNSLLQRPRTIIANRAAVTTQLVDAFKAMDEVLTKQLDPLAETFSLTAPAFHLAYFAARVIVDNAGPGEEDEEPEPPPTP